MVCHKTNLRPLCVSFDRSASFPAVTFFDDPFFREVQLSGVVPSGRAG
jgi:hypothetical protein